MRKIKVLWLCNSPSHRAGSALGIKRTPKEGWLIEISNRLYDDCEIEFTYVFHSSSIAVVLEASNIEGNYVAVPEECGINEFAAILKKYNPDIIHIWGTEYKKAYNMTEAAKQLGMVEKVVISIQGLVGAYYYHYMGNIPGRIQIFPTIRDIIRNDTLLKQQKDFLRRGVFEKEAIKNVNHVIGRTFWDYSYCHLVNPNVYYHFNNETLRNGFYVNSWKKECCIPHRLFISQATYPLKGFHYLIEALGILKENYPDIQVVVAGANNTFRPYLLDSSYGRYIRNLIKRNDLQNNIKYIGMLDEQAIIQEYLKAEVFVSPSMIENSPNSVGEAMLLGMPVVSSNVGGISDLLNHGSEGFLYQADAPYLLAYYIQKFFENEDIEITCGMNAKRHAIKTHNPEKNYRDLKEIYLEILKCKIYR